MELKLIDGTLRWIRADAKPSPTAVKEEDRLRFYGFDVPMGRRDSVVVIEGDPARDEILLLRIYARKGWGFWLIAKGEPMATWAKERYVEPIRQALRGKWLSAEDLEEQLERLESEWDREIEGRVRGVDAEALAERRLKIHHSRKGFGYWVRDPEGNEHDFLIPDGYAFLPAGDPVLTRGVRKGSHFVLMRKNGKWSETVGTFAPEERIAEALEKHGSEEELSRRKESREQVQAAREERITRDFADAILRRFASIPGESLNRVIEHARTSRSVGRAAWLYFAGQANYRENLEEAAYLAVQAFVRHEYTHYDELMATGRDRRAARDAVRGKIDEMLDKWS